jgi:uncharacterized protein (UPF0332 family)
VSGETEDLIRHRLDRARETLEEARLMYGAGHNNACVNRLYYACFYAVSALLISRGMVISKHSGVRSLFGQHFIKTGVVSKDLGAFYNGLFDSRQESDYTDFYKADNSVLPAWLTQTETFINTIAEIIAPAH